MKTVSEEETMEINIQNIKNFKPISNQTLDQEKIMPLSKLRILKRKANSNGSLTNAI